MRKRSRRALVTSRTLGYGFGVTPSDASLLARTGTGQQPPLRRRRDSVIDQLGEHFARDRFDVEEFERRVDAAHTATTREALSALIDDLDPLDDHRTRALEHASEVRQAESSAALITRPERRSVIAVLSGAERRGHWRLPAVLRVWAVAGGVELDFRDVAFPPGVTEVKVFCFMGGCEIIVPPNIHLECDGIGILGGFETVERVPPRLEPDEPVLRISGVAVMGGFSVETRLPGESRRDARKRRRRESKEASRRHQLSSGED